MTLVHRHPLAFLAFALASTPNLANGSVTLHPGDNIQSQVDADPGATTFVFAPGTYTNQSIVPKAGDVFDGQGVGILDGGNTATRAFGGSAANVTIMNLTIQHYNSTLQHAAVDCEFGNAWTVTNCIIQSNTSVGVNFGNNSRILNNWLVSNGEEGFAGGGAGWLVQNNQINNNNTSHQNWGFEAGGGKVTLATSGTFDGNTVTNNDGPGIWLDIDANGILIQSNICIGDYCAGIMVEISKYNTVSNNLCVNNGIGLTDWQAAQILISTSASNTVCGNILGVPDRSNRIFGVFIMDQGRTDSMGNPIHATGNEVYGNHAWFWTTKTGVHGCDTDEGYPVFADNRFHNNTYHAANPSVRYFSWEDDYTLAQAQASGYEAGSTIDNVMTPLLDILKSNSSISLYWPSWAIDFRLWSTTDLGSSGGWSAVADTIAVTTDRCSMTLGTSNGACLFRLVQP
jgi:parallel beta-helix repeat protein